MDKNAARMIIDTALKLKKNPNRDDAVAICEFVLSDENGGTTFQPWDDGLLYSNSGIDVFFDHVQQEVVLADTDSHKELFVFTDNKFPLRWLTQAVRDALMYKAQRGKGSVAEALSKGDIYQGLGELAVELGYES